MSIRPATLRRIEDAHRFGAFYRGYLANHLPMALVALDQMGADDARLARFEREYVTNHLEPIGSHPEFQAAVAALCERIAKQGRDAVLRSELDRLAAGVGSGAFHGAIRAAYALESGSEREMAHALAYWSLAFEPLPELPAPTGREPPLAVLASLARDPRFAKRRFPGNNIAERLKNASRHPGFAAIVARVDPAALTLDTLAAALIRVYAASNDFTMLHGVTGTHAFGLLSPYAGDPARAVGHLWQAVVAAYLGAGSPAVEGDALAGNGALGWPQIHALAIQCSDEHDVKLAYSCWREGERTGDDLYRRVASSRVCHSRRETMAC